jgi:hypothetical protein
MELAFGFLLVSVVLWCTFWGGVGYLLATQRGANGGRGAAWCILLGPVGLLVVLWSTRRSWAARRVLRDTVIDLTDEPATPDDDWGVGPTRRTRQPSVDGWQ